MELDAYNQTKWFIAYTSIRKICVDQSECSRTDLIEFDDARTQLELELHRIRSSHEDQMSIARLELLDSHGLVSKLRRQVENLKVDCEGLHGRIAKNEQEYQGRAAESSEVHEALFHAINVQTDEVDRWRKQHAEDIETAHMDAHQSIQIREQDAAEATEAIRKARQERDTVVERVLPEHTGHQSKADQAMPTAEKDWSDELQRVTQTLKEYQSKADQAVRKAEKERDEDLQRLSQRQVECQRRADDAIEEAIRERDSYRQAVEQTKGYRIITQERLEGAQISGSAMIEAARIFARSVAADFLKLMHWMEGSIERLRGLSADIVVEAEGTDVQPTPMPLGSHGAGAGSSKRKAVEDVAGPSKRSRAG